MDSFPSRKAWIPVRLGGLFFLLALFPFPSCGPKLGVRGPPPLGLGLHGPEVGAYGEDIC